MLGTMPWFVAYRNLYGKGFDKKTIGHVMCFPVEVVARRLSLRKLSFPTKTFPRVSTIGKPVDFSNEHCLVLPNADAHIEKKSNI
jgi:hypothetical protein